MKVLLGEMCTVGLLRTRIVIVLQLESLVLEYALLFLYHLIIIDRLLDTDCHCTPVKKFGVGICSALSISLDYYR
jgi:hypothetical protein